MCSLTCKALKSFIRIEMVPWFPEIEKLDASDTLPEN